ncbi:MAG: TraB/GumN family protein [Hyphomicrobiales bacterium]
MTHQLRIFCSLLILAFSLTLAHGQSVAKCAGTDLLKTLKDKDAKAYNLIFQNAEKEPNGKGVFWRIEKEGTEPSWLLGTMHTTDERLLEFVTKHFSFALDKAASVAIENLDVTDPAKVQKKMAENAQLVFFTDGTSIKDHLTSEEQQQLLEATNAFGIPFDAISLMKPWVSATFLSIPACEHARQGQGIDFLDKAIYQAGKKNGAKLVGLETFEEQMSAMGDLPLKDQIAFLNGAAQSAPIAADLFETMTQLYLAENISAIVPMTKHFSRKVERATEVDKLFESFSKELIVKRNKLMHDRALPLILEGNAFIAVGALHLPGDKGLVNLLRKSGYTVTRHSAQ